MSRRVGVDIGGTFIDFCVLDDESGALSTLKVLTTPDNPGAEVVAGLARLTERDGLDPASIVRFVHGTTVGVNTVIQNNGARIALFTTENFCDVLELARLRMPETYSLFSARAEPLVPRERVFPIAERLRADGSVARPLQRESVVAAVAGARAAGAEGIVVSLLHAYRNAAHEAEVARLVGELAPDLFVFTSTEVWPVIREYERTTTVAINGYVHPKVSHYIARLQAALRALGVPGEPLITKSNGGVMAAELGKRNCVSMLLSGTASGVMGAAFLARQAGIGDVLTIDIGGTSADVAVISGGRPHYATGEKVGEHALHVPAVAVSSIGQGGGSLARVDEHGLLKVGPQSAGSVPGPVCYGRGGRQATLTDAFAVAGLIGHESLAYGALALDRAAACAALGDIAAGLGRPVPAAAQAVIDVAISGMYLEINKLMARHGIDGQAFTLLAFGGAGPMLAPMLARELGIARVMIPLHPGTVSALGGLVADIRNDFIASLFRPVAAETMADMAAGFARLQGEAERWLREEQGHDGAVEYRLSADMAYAGQSFEIEVDLAADWVVRGDVAAIRQAFHARHEALYAYRDEKAAVQAVNLRLVAVAAAPGPVMAARPAAAFAAVPVRTVEALFDGARVPAGLYRRADLTPGATFAGPAIVLQADTTCCIPPGFGAHVDAFGNILLTATAA
ncbi:hydantoinase/oxoprolinase family protein [Pseudoxanthobacter sp.]|uniref:hydantoinase/oxoprolinase family protein n=1 Tax=Pseudoxanthobacter sp. TaxID=1925742 RepID=UPI002FE0D5FA